MFTETFPVAIQVLLNSTRQKLEVKGLALISPKERMKNYDQECLNIADAYKMDYRKQLS